jgi:hypothetical protein
MFLQGVKMEERKLSASVALSMLLSTEESNKPGFMKNKYY